MGAQEDHERFSSIAEELGLEGDDAGNFVNSAMKRKGYKPQMTWTDPEPESGNDGGDFFGGGNKPKERRDVGGGGNKGGGWQY